MKRILLHFTFLFLLSFHLTAQQYSLSVSNEPYNDLLTPTSVNNDLTWDDPEFNVPLGFTFQMLDTEVDTLFFDYEDNQFVSNLDENIPNAFFSMTGLDIADRAFDINNDAGLPGSLSPISYQMTGNTGDRIFKMEWKNAGFYDDLEVNGSSTDFINFQIWLYEANGDIEYRFGDNSLEKMIEIFANFDEPLYFETGFDPYYEYYEFSSEGVAVVGDDPVNPELLPLNTIESGLMGPIPSGTMYRFSTTPTNVNKLFSGENNLKISPNPVVDVLNIETSIDADVIEKIQILDAQGRVLKTTRALQQIDLNHLASGCYSLHLITAEAVLVEQFIKI